MTVRVEKLSMSDIEPGNALSLTTTSLKASADSHLSSITKSQLNGQIWVICIENPAARNAINQSIAIQLYKIFKQFDSDSAARVAILRGSNGSFCAGADLSSLSNPLEPPTSSDIGPLGPTRLQLGKPVIAAVEGFAVAGGFELALWCDLRVASVDAVFGVFCRSKGVPLIDGGTFRLSRLVGMSLASDLILTGRPLLAADAHKHNLVNRLVMFPSSSTNDWRENQTLLEAVKLAAIIASHPQECLRRDRFSLLKCQELSEKNALETEWSITRPSLDSGDLKSAVGSFFRKGKL